MCDDEDLYVVIIGDEEDSFKPDSIHIKEEILDDELRDTVGNLLTNAEQQGEVFNFDFNDPDVYCVQNKLVKLENIKIEQDDEDFCYNQYVVPDSDHIDVSESIKSKRRKHDKPIKSNSCIVEIKLEECDKEYVPDDEDIESDNYLSDSSEKSKRKRGRPAKVKRYDPSKSNEDLCKELLRRRMLPRSECRSYVRELLKNYPELKGNRKLLIDCLVEVMKSTKPPQLPDGYCVTNQMFFQCGICEAVSESLPAAGRHYQEKHGERYLFCLACGVDFRSKTNLYKHEKRCDAPDATIVLEARARFLGRKGRSRPFLLDHPKLPKKSSYQSVPRFKCSQCTASFCSKSGLQAHEHLHRGERPFLCPHCPRSYTSQTTLTRHLHLHGDQKYICDHCLREFKIKGALIMHMNTHEPLKRFPCPRCTKRYSQKAALSLHIHRDHLRLPLPCACQLCPKRYPRMSVLKEHMKKVHGMNIMTRKMFFKKLPTMTETQLQQAKVVLKQTLNNFSTVVYQEDEQLKYDHES